MDVAAAVDVTIMTTNPLKIPTGLIGPIIINGQPDLSGFQLGGRSQHQNLKVEGIRNPQLHLDDLVRLHQKFLLTEREEEKRREEKRREEKRIEKREEKKREKREKRREEEIEEKRREEREEEKRREEKISSWSSQDTVKVRHVDAHVPKSRANEEHRNNEQVDQAAKIEVSKIDLDWQHKGELFLARWAHDASAIRAEMPPTSGPETEGWIEPWTVFSQVIHDCETCAAIKQAKRVKPLWYGGRWSKYKYGEAWQIDYITLPQTRQGKRYVLTMVEATRGWLETYPVPHATARNTILSLEKTSSLEAWYP
ncbi:hypothetical protein DUI87_27037 [Hirundo rustica rustica]|uniref:Integrase catalytic domain-containing protein n=1 Tax=Hirundo rustica rustica TaxID=333673 RepID=A0A3M0J6F7_HIRRU|nr:hypothetical protein DUI87_27037 [Hirundo rustica rustica]